MNSNQYYDKYKRNQASREFYKSAAWEKCREVVLIRDNYLCQDCLKQNKITPADMVHHIKELEQHPEVALDLDNLVGLCDSCHNKQHSGPKEKQISKKLIVIKSKKNPDVI
jgi:5-methylcytosine-specific restriction enzyme A